MHYSRFLATYLIIAILALVSTPAFSQVSISIDVAPPPLIVDDQPACPDDGYIWTPGFWSYDDNAGEYYWVAGTWVQPPQVGLLWTPAYWGWNGNAYAFYPGYWGPTVGFYGGVNYGHGYWGNGYGGGRWDNGHFNYNTAANNVTGGRIHNTYIDKSVVRSNSSRVSYNGGKGGLSNQPTPQEQQFAHESHVQPTAQQQSHIQTASQERSHQVKVNKPAGTAAAPQPQSQPEHQVNPQGSQQFTGGDNQPDRKTAPVNPGAAPSNNQNKTEEKPDFTNNKPAPDRTEPQASVNNQARPEEQSHAPSEQHAPESHSAQGAPAAIVHHDNAPSAPQVHAGPQAQAKPEAKPEAQPQGGGQQGQPGGSQGGGGQDHPGGEQHH